MGRGRSGRVLAMNATNAERSRTAGHPSVTDIDVYGELNRGRRSKQHINAGPNDGPSDESVQWFMDNMGMNKNEAYRAADVFLFYSRGGDKFMHWNTDDGNGKVNNDLIDRVLDNRKSPVFAGEHFRGVFFANDKFNGDARTAINDIISNGVWREEGASSFSSNLKTAHSFGMWEHAATSNDGVSVTIRHVGGSGMPMKHLSSFASENEVVHSRKQMKNGLEIVRSQWSPNGKQVYIWVKDR